MSVIGLTIMPNFDYHDTITIVGNTITILLLSQFNITMHHDTITIPEDLELLIISDRRTNTQDLKIVKNTFENSI